MAAIPPKVPETPTSNVMLYGFRVSTSIEVLGLFDPAFAQLNPMVTLALVTRWHGRNHHAFCTRCCPGTPWVPIYTLLEYTDDGFNFFKA